MLATLMFYAADFFFFFNDTATTEIYTLSLHDALPISIGEHVDAGAPQHPRADFRKPRRAARVQDFHRHARPPCPCAGHGERGGVRAVAAARGERRGAGDQYPTSAFQKSTVSRTRGQRPSITRAMRRAAARFRIASRSWGTRAASERRSSWSNGRPGSR